MRWRTVWAVGLLALLCLAWSGVDQIMMAQPQPAALTVAQQEKDLRTLAAMLETHPLFLQQPGRRPAFAALVRRTVREAAYPLPSWRFMLLADRLVHWFHDPHTYILFDTGHVPYGILPLAFYWTTDGLVAVRVPGSPPTVATGDRVLSLSGVPAQVIGQRMESLVAGNPYWVHSAPMTEQMSLGPVLHGLGVVRKGGQVVVSLESKDGRRFSVPLQLNPWSLSGLAGLHNGIDGFLERYLGPRIRGLVGGPDWSWVVTPRYAYFRLASCVDNISYERAVQRFFEQVAAQGARDVVLDVSENTGGDFTVMDAWLAHLPAPYAQADDRQVDRQSPEFNGRLYVLQSSTTFSSAMLLDAALTGPGRGIRVGEPVGEATAGWGSAGCQPLPESGICAAVSGSYVQVLPGPVLPMLRPAIPLGLTVADVQRGIDPVARWLHRLGH